MLLTLHPGSQIHDRYLIRQTLCQEENICTYLVEDQSHFKELYVLTQLAATEKDGASIAGKLLSPDLQALTQLKHPNIQCIKDYFWDNHQMFILQEYIEGKTYQEILHSRPRLTEPETLKLLDQLLSALQYLHQQNITHGNISPQNIVAKADSHVPVLVNFGIVQTIQSYLKLGITESENTEHSIDSTQLLSSDPGFVASAIKRDLQNLAVTALILLTGQTREALFDPTTQTWNWENWVLLSDQLTRALNRMLTANDAPIAADEILRILRSNLPVREVRSSSAAAVPLMQQNLSGHVTAPFTEPDASGDLKKAMLIGGMIGLSVLISAVILRTQMAGLLTSRSTMPSPDQTSPVEPQTQVSPSAIPIPPIPTTPSAPSVPPVSTDIVPEPPIATLPSPIAPPTVQPQVPAVEQTNATITGEPGSKNIRSGAGTNYGVQHLAYPGDRVQILGSAQDKGGYTWYKVYFPKSGAEGWIAAQLVKVD